MSVTVPFLLRLSEVKYHWLKSGKGEKTVNLLCLITRNDQISLPHVLTITNKSSTFDSFSSAKLYQHIYISRLHVVMKSREI